MVEKLTDALPSRRGVRIRALAVALVIATGVTVGAGGCAMGCPAALLTGVLVEEGGELVVVPDGGGPVERVEWPSGHGVHRDGGVLVVTDLFGTVKAREGDLVRLGGGEAESGTWTACGLLEAEPPPTPATG